MPPSVFRFAHLPGKIELGLLASTFPGLKPTSKDDGYSLFTPTNTRTAQKAPAESKGRYPDKHAFA